MEMHPDIGLHLANLRGDEMRQHAAEARLAAQVQRDRRQGSGPDEVLLAGRSFRILRRRRISLVPKTQV